MAEAVSSRPNFTYGRFVWHEIMTPDVARSKAYYAELLGWKFQDFDMGGSAYPMIMAGGVPQGGLQAVDRLPLDGASPHVMGFLSVPAVDEAVAAARAEGGRTVAEPVDLPQVGRLAVLADGTGAVFSVLHSSQGDGPEPERPAPGSFGWDQLNTTDIGQARRFYRRVLGWRHSPPGMGSDVQLFVRDGAGDGHRPGRQAASFRQAPPGVASHWLSHVVVDHLPAARSRAVRLGGKVLLDQLAIPGHGTVAVVTDNVGVRLGLFQHEPRAAASPASRKGRPPARPAARR